MGIKKHLFLSVFSMFFALFGGVGVAHAANYLPKCDLSIPVVELDRNFEGAVVEGADISGFDMRVYLSNGQTMHTTAFCSDGDDSADTPAESTGSFCWCGLDGYTDADGHTSTSSIPTWVFMGDHSSYSNCEADCASKCLDTIREGPSEFGKLCLTFKEECREERTVIGDEAFYYAGIEGSISNSPDWELRFDGGQVVYGTSFCSFTDNGGSRVPSTVAGQYCWCGISQYVNGDNHTYNSIPETWWYYSDMSDTNNCNDECASKCADQYANSRIQIGEEIGICYNSTTYNVTYVCGNGTSLADSTDFFPGDIVTAPNGTQCATPTGYVFKDWSCNNNIGQVSGGATFTMPAGDVTCTAKWTPNIYTIRLLNNTSIHSKIYEKYNTGWYKNAAATQVLSQASKPTRSGYTFRGFYTTTQSDLTASGGSGTRRITNTGGLPANTTFTANTDLYAAWALNCSAGTGCNCTLNINSNGTVTYATSAQSGYTLTSGSGTYAPVCSAIDYTVTFDHGPINSSTTKHVGDSVTLPTSFERPGYSFGGWSCDNGIGNKAVGETFTMPAANVTCTAQWAQQNTYPFTLTTTSLSANSTFQFTMSAQGTFYVDCGTNGTLSGEGNAAATVSGNTITKSNTTSYTYTCTYSSAGAKTVRFGGAATEYSASTSVSVIRFTSPTLVDAISGDLSQIFPESVSAGSRIPRFISTFEGCSNLVSIPDTLFSQYTKTGQYMFWYTFKDCTGLGTSNNPGVVPITAGLFSGITGFYTSVPQAGFYYTFQGCTGLTSIPEDLFLGIRNSASVARFTFSGTFQGCTGLTSIPEELFSGITTVAQSSFISTFQDCTGLTSIPKELFSGITTAAQSSFDSTFKGCTGLTSIPEELFSGITTVAQSSFASTFQGCTGLTSIPSELFGNVSGAPAVSMFASTFSGCSNLSGFGDKTYVPGDFLENITTNTSVSNQTANMFSGTQLNNPCPANTYASTRQQFNNAGKPWCTECPSGTTSPAGSTSASQCVVPFTVTYACGSGVSGTAPTDTNSYTPNSTVYTVQSFGTCSKDGYYASGWVCGGTSVASGGTFTITANTTCVAQWTGNDISLTWDGGGTPSSCTYGGTFVPPTPAPRVGYVFTGWRVRPMCSFTASEVRGMSGVGSGYTRLNGGTGYKEAQYGLTTPGEWATELTTGIIKGMAKCSSRSGTYATPGTPSDTNGGGCWCSATNYTPNGGNQCNFSSSSWVFSSGRGSADDCASDCANVCANGVQGNSGFRRALFGVQ